MSLLIKPNASAVLKQLSDRAYKALGVIHKCLFEDIYNFAGEQRTVNLAKGNFRFAPLMYLETPLEATI